MHDCSYLLILQKPISFKIVITAASGELSNALTLGMILSISGESELVLNSSPCHHHFSLHTLLMNLATFSANKHMNDWQGLG